MRSIIYDEIANKDLDKLRKAAAKTCTPSNFPDVYWLILPEEQLNREQKDHAKSCGPHRLAIVFEDDHLKVELLVRAQESLRCTCTSYADAKQTRYVLEVLDGMLDQCGVTT